METEVDDAELYLLNVQDCVNELIVNFSDKGELALEIGNHGAQILDLIDVVLPCLGKVDARVVDKRDVSLELRQFCTQCEVFDKQNNNSSKAMKVRRMSRNVEKFLSSLKDKWNTKLKSKEEETSPDATSQSNGDWRYDKISPKKTEQSFECSDCIEAKGKSFVYTNAQSFIKHLKKDHQKKDPDVSVPKVTCRLKHKDGKTRQVRWDLLGRHLKDQHNEEKPSADHVCDGFLTEDGGKTYKVFWKKAGEPDPTPPSSSSSNQAAPVASNVIGPKVSLSVPSSSSSVTNKRTKEIPSTSSSITPSSIESQVEGNGDTPDGSKKITPNEEDSSKELNKCPLVPAEEVEEAESSVPIINDPVLTEEPALNEVTHSPNIEPEPEKCKKRLFSALSADSLVNDEDVPVQQEILCTTVGDESMDVDDDDEQVPLSNAVPQADQPIVIQLPASTSGVEPDQLVTLELPVVTDPVPDDDIEENDDEAFTELRLSNKRDRYENRNLVSDDWSLMERDGNMEFIAEMKNWIMKNQDSSSGGKNPTISSTIGKLFKHDYSYLTYYSDLDQNFTLDKLLKFKDPDNFVELQTPFAWIDSLGGEDGKAEPSKRKEMYKCFARLRNFIKDKVDSTTFANDQERDRRDRILANLTRIKDVISDKKPWNKLETMIQQDKRELDNAKAILNPGKDLDETMALEKYISSKEYKDREAKNDEVFEKAVASQKVKPRDFNELGNWARHILFFTDSSRQGCYNFNNDQFFARKPVFFPPEFDINGDFEDVPRGYNIYKRPNDGRDPDLYVLNLTGKEVGMKLGEAATIIINQRALDILMKYREVKEIVFGELKGEDKFFIKFDGSDFGPMLNSRGSILHEVSKVTGVTNINTTSFRRALDHFMQGKKGLMERTKDVAYHSESVQRKHYVKTRDAFRASAMHFVSSKRGASQPSASTSKEISDDQRAKRARIDEADHEASRRKAIETLRKHSEKNIQLGPQCKILPQDRRSLQCKLGSGRKYDLLKNFKKFPDPPTFRRVFYRFLDSLPDDEDGRTFRAIELKTFKVIKSKVEADCGGKWVGDLHQNAEADKKVAAALLSSFKSYEVNRKDYDEAFFVF